MKPRLEREVFRQAQQVVTDFERLIRLLPEVFARDDEAPTQDGYGSSSMGGPGGKGGISDPTGSRAARGAVRDTVGVEVEKIAHIVLDVARMAQNAVNAAQHVLKEAPAERVASVPDCLACGELALPRPRRGCCGACWEAWRRFRAHTPDFAAFVVQRKQQLADTSDSA